MTLKYHRLHLLTGTLDCYKVTDGQGVTMMQAAASEYCGLLTQFLPIISGSHIRPTVFGKEIASIPYAVLIMEGNIALARLLATGLKAEALSVDVTPDLDSAGRLLKEKDHQLLILDLDLPDLDGLALLDDLRARRPDAQILVLSGRNGMDGLVAALDHGADDYLQKPFSLLEMMARVRVLRRRRVSSPRVATQKTGTLVLDRDQCRVERDGRSIDLTPREFSLLEYMVRNPGKTLSRAMLTQEVWNMPAEANTNIVDVYVKYLRDKLDGEHDEKLIRTIRGTGYLFQYQA